MIKVISYLPFSKNINGVYKFEPEMTISTLIKQFNIKWDQDALVIINKQICINSGQKLADGDIVELLIPLSGG